MTSLYVISEGEGGPVKVGVSSNPGWRVSSLQTGNPRQLTLVWQKEFASRAEAFAVERDAHDVLGLMRKGGEWFDCDAKTAILCITGACLP